MKMKKKYFSWEMSAVAALTAIVMGCAGNSGHKPAPADTHKEEPAQTNQETTASQEETPAPQEELPAPQEESPAIEKKETKTQINKTGKLGGKTKIANPASVNCIDKGGKLEIMDGKGGQFGVCIFKDGSRCEEWSFFRGKCAPGTCMEESGICKEKE